jgi:undecaprenyl-diphosphatase
MDKQAWWVAVFLGVVEGITEFLPISSTGHLLIAQHFVPRQSDFFNIIIQSATVGAIFFHFHRPLRERLAGSFRGEGESIAFLLKLGIAFLVTVVGALGLHALKIDLPEHMAPVAWATLIGGICLFGVEKWFSGRGTAIGFMDAVGVGVAQTVAAAFPGASRSGTCLLFLLFRGVSRAEATDFTFMLGIPTLLAAGCFKWMGLWSVSIQESWSTILLGCVASACSATLVVHALLRYIQLHSYLGLAVYRILLGISLLVWTYCF